MKQHRIITGTITYAIRGRDLLREHGFGAYIERLTGNLENLGCGYSILLTGERGRAESILRQAGIKILRIDEVI